MAFQINVGGQLRRERPRFCADCGLPLGYYSDMRSACGVKSLLLERCRYTGRLAGLCRVPPCPFRIFGNELCAAVLAFVLGDHDVARRLRARCVIWQLTMNQLEASGSFFVDLEPRDVNLMIFRKLMRVIGGYSEGYPTRQVQSTP